MMRKLRSTATTTAAILLLLSTTRALAFFFVATTGRPSIPMFSMSTTATDNTNNSPILLSGVNIELTPALEAYVDKRIGNTLAKLAKNGAVRECDVVLSVNKNPKVKNAHRVEIVTNVKGTTIICKNESPDMYGSIDAVGKALNRKLKKYKERRTEGWHGGGHMGDDLAKVLDELEENNAAEVEEEDDEDEDDEYALYEDPEKPKVLKVNSFQTDKPISLDEAVFALDYVDHDFYVFRNAETNKINVVYKRHTGGVGLVEP